ncbi:MAG: hypothetical protein U9R02_02985, partial [Thermodesulfobacteriota bacterium]|nr:hypothetical protein [Thermodesulfobacteriota bacterium]
MTKLQGGECPIYFKNSYNILYYWLLIKNSILLIQRSDDIEIEEIYSKGRRKVQVEARDLLCYWSVRELGISCTDLAKQ